MVQYRAIQFSALHANLRWPDIFKHQILRENLILHSSKYVRFSHIWRGIAFYVRICVIYECKFIGSEKIGPVILVAFTAHHALVMTCNHAWQTNIRLYADQLIPFTLTVCIISHNEILIVTNDAYRINKIFPIMLVDRLLSGLQFNWWGSWQEATILVNKIMPLYCSVVICLSLNQIRYAWVPGSFGLLLLLLWFILDFMISWGNNEIHFCVNTLCEDIYKVREILYW